MTKSYGKLAKRVEDEKQRREGEAQKLAEALPQIREATAYMRAGPRFQAYVSRTLAEMPTYRDAVLSALTQADGEVNKRLAGIANEIGYKLDDNKKSKPAKKKKKSANGGRVSMPELKDTAAPLYRAGLTYSDIGKVYKVSTPTALRNARNGGIKKGADNPTNVSVKRVSKALGLTKRATESLLTRKKIEF